MTQEFTGSILFAKESHLQILTIGLQDTQSMPTTTYSHQRFSYFLNAHSMIKVGAIRKLWKGWRLLVFAFVDDNSCLKSRFILKEKCMDGKKYLIVGKGVRADGQVVKLCVSLKSKCSHYKSKSMVWDWHRQMGHCCLSC